jgi:hypothetical protein
VNIVGGWHRPVADVPVELRRLRRDVPKLHSQRLSVHSAPSGNTTHAVPKVRVEVGLQLRLEAALQNYDVIDATPQERQVLQQWGHPFGGVQ